MRVFFRQNVRLICAFLSVLLFCGMVSLMFAADTVIETGAWGLHFEKEGAAPVGNASRAALGQYDAAFCGDGTEKVIYLTFDCGYENGYTATMLDTLKAHDAKACFFVVGNYLETAPELVKRMADEGHTVGNHTWHHYDMSHISDPETFTRELSSVAEKYEQLVGRPMEKFYRPPQGIFSEENLRTAQQLGYKTVFWSLAYVDWYQDDQPTHEQAFSKLLGRIHPGAVVLLHSTSRTNAEILDELLTKWEQDGYRFAPISELFSGDAHKEGARA